MTGDEKEILDAAAQLFTLIFRQASAVVLDGSYVQELEACVEDETLDAQSAESAVQQIATPGARLLDFGCGAGAHQLWLEDAGYEWHGVDYLDAVAPSVAADVAQQADRVVFYGGKILPFRDRYFDVVYSMLSLQHIQHIDTTFSEVRRVLKDGGSFVGQVSYLEQMQDFSSFNFTPYGLKLAAASNGLSLARIWPKHDAFTFLLRRLLITTGSSDATPFNDWLNPEGWIQEQFVELSARFGLSIARTNLLRLLFGAHFVFHIKG